MRLSAFLFLLGTVPAAAQTLTPTVLAPLDAALNETSGLVVIDGHVWTQLDSGNPHHLYEVDPSSGGILRSVTVHQAENVDWEEITTDDTWLYIGDFGNNAGARTNLCVYRVALAELNDVSITDIYAEQIRFTYPDQTDFTSADHANDRDCEAMIAMDDTLFLFSKNWLHSTTYLYALPAVPGDQLAVRRDTLDAQGLITGASLDTATGTIALCGYTTGLSPFVWLLSGYEGHDLFQGSAVRHPLQSALTQVEGIAWHAPGQLYLSNEHNALSPARLWDLGVDLPTEIPARTGHELDVRADAVQQALIVTVLRPCRWELLEADGKVVRQGHFSEGINSVGTRGLTRGMYVLCTDTPTGRASVLIGR